MADESPEELNAPQANPTPKTDTSSTTESTSNEAGLPWYRGLSKYQWYVLLAASLGWLFDTMDQQFFALARTPALLDLTGFESGGEEIKRYGGYATAIFIVGWASGGLIFGVLGDRFGRVKVMAATILVYSVFTGLSAISTSFWDFAVFRFLTGLGVGGEFAVGVSLIAEVMPARSRPFALGLLQALSAVGNVTAAGINYLLGYMQREELAPGLFELVEPWQIMFLIGALPALLVVFILLGLREPDAWKKAVSQEGELGDDKPKKEVGSYKALFGESPWRRHAIVGFMLAFSGVVGLWGIGFFYPELTGEVFSVNLEPAVRAELTEQGLVGDELEASIDSQVSARVTELRGIAGIMFNLGAFFGISSFTYLTAFVGRRPAFLMALIAAMLSTMSTFFFLDEIWHIYLLYPLMGFCQLSLFGGYAIYFPELFPTRLRSTGTSFCYNVGRYVAAAGVLGFGTIAAGLQSSLSDDSLLSTRYAGIIMCAVFLVGMFALPFAPETKDKPLPE